MTTPIFILLIILISGFVGYYFIQRKYGYKTISDLFNALQTWFKNLQTKKDESVTSSTLVIKNGKTPIKLDISADIPEGSTVHITLKVVDKSGKSRTQKSTLERNTKPAKKSKPAKESPQVTAWGIASQNNGNIFLIIAIIVYGLVISFGIDRFPIYFFTDEAIHMNLVADFIRDGYRNYDKEFLPTFFIIEGWVNGTSVYVQLLPYLIFGKSMAVTRLVSAFITLLAALSLGLLLKQVYKIKYYWVGIFLLLTTPAWFFHARTAFEYAEVASFYMIFLYFYGRYREGHLKSLYFAIIAGALAFYTHGLGQILMTITGIALFVIDFRYHAHPERRKTIVYALVLGLILLLPFVRYYLAHSSESLEQVQRRGSYWFKDELTPLQKITEFIKQYTYGLSPHYWYLTNPVDFARHVMKNYGNGLLITFPFALIGFIQVIRNIRQSPYHIALIAFLAAPLPASIVAIGMPRMLWMSIPLAILTSIGLSLSLEKLEIYLKNKSTWLPAITCALLTLLSTFMLRDALTNGPTWFTDYGLYGMQYGAKQVFADTIVPELEKDPNLLFVVSPTWANGTDEFAEFFIPTQYSAQVIFGQPTNRIDPPSNLTPNTRFVTTANEYQDLLKDPKFKEITIHKTILYPDGNPGFYLISLAPVDNIEEILEAERLQNITPIESTVEVNGQTMRLIHSPFDSGVLESLFDNNPETLIKVVEANPFVFDFYPTTPINIQSAVIQTGSLPNFTITISLYAPNTDTPQVYTQNFQGLPPDPIITINFDQGPTTSARMYLEIKDNNSGESSQIHVRQIHFK